MSEPRSLKRLLTLAFAPNVGRGDRVFRAVSGAALAGLGWWLRWPLAAALACSVLGAMWFATAVLSRCSIYYALGYSTCPVKGR